MTEPPPTFPKESRPRWRAPDWLQLFVIIGLLGAAVFVALFGRYIWCFWLALAGIAFGIAFVLRRMVGDEYDRT